MFEAYTQLLTEMVLRLPYQIKKIADTNSRIPPPVFDHSWFYFLSEVSEGPEQCARPGVGTFASTFVACFLPSPGCCRKRALHWFRTWSCPSSMCCTVRLQDVYPAISCGFCLCMPGFPHIRWWYTSLVVQLCQVNKVY